jgi:hypothetical protein
MTKNPTFPRKCNRKSGNRNRGLPRIGNLDYAAERAYQLGGIIQRGHIGNHHCRTARHPGSDRSWHARHGRQHTQRRCCCRRYRWVGGTLAHTKRQDINQRNMIHDVRVWRSRRHPIGRQHHQRTRCHAEAAFQHSAHADLLSHDFPIPPRRVASRYP